jgi:hypothetical protein
MTRTGSKYLSCTNFNCPNCLLDSTSNEFNRKHISEKFIAAVMVVKSVYSSEKSQDGIAKKVIRPLLRRQKG